MPTDKQFDQCSKQDYEDSIEFDVTNPDGIIQYASEQKITYKVSDEFLRNDLISKGVTAEKVDNYIDEANAILNQYNKKIGKQQIWYGILGAVLGPVMIIVGLGDSQKWRPGLVFIGLGFAVWGIVEIIRGILRRNQSKK